MYPGIHDVVRGCHIQEFRLDMISNNLANANTAGFKKDILFFDKVLQVHQKTNMAQGNMRHTDNPLDVALAGDGFFKVSTANGVRYTRNGRFGVNGQGVLATMNGDPVLGESGTITIDGKEITIDGNGAVRVDGDEVDRLSIVSFDQEEYLRKEGFSCFKYTGEDGEGAPPQETSVKQGYLEESNVVVTQEVIKMMETLRCFEAYQKVLQSFDETDGKVINEVGKL